MEMEGKVKNPFERFPKEIWEMMLDQVEDSRDIVTALRGIPKLDISITSTKRLWYISQVLPFLYNRISQKDALNLRLVCKQWQRRVDHFLLNQPYYRAYSEDLHKDNLNFWMFVDGRRCRFRGLENFRGAYKSVDTNQAEHSASIMDNFLEHPQTRNPFVFRELTFSITGEGDLVNRQINKTFTFLEQYGTHLWYLNIYMKLPVTTLEFFNLVKILCYVPNMKTLYLDGSEVEAVPRSRFSLFLQFMDWKLPQLPCLESIHLFGDDGVYTDEFLARFLKRYGPQIQRLLMPLHRWKVEEFKDLFPQLTELGLDACVRGDLNVSEMMSLLWSLLRSISSPKLVSLRIEFTIDDEDKEVTISIEKDVFKWLKQFPQIKNFEIIPFEENKSEVALTEGEAASKECFPSLQTLKIFNLHGLSYNFLRSFPSLRNLKIRVCSYPTVEHFSISNSCIKLREQIQTGKLYESNIWTVLPKLNKIVLERLIDGKERQLEFDRTTYEKLMNAGQIPSKPQLHPFRQDIQDFLAAYAEHEDHDDDESGEED